MTRDVIFRNGFYERAKENAISTIYVTSMCPDIVKRYVSQFSILHFILNQCFFSGKRATGTLLFLRSFPVVTPCHP